MAELFFKEWGALRTKPVALLYTTYSQKLFSRDFPTGSFTILGPQDQEIGEIYVSYERRRADFEATKLRKGRSGSLPRTL